MKIDELISAIGSLSENEKAELIGKLQASAAKPCHTIKTLRAAHSAVPNKGLITQMLARARSLGVDLEMDKIVDPGALNKALSGKPVADRVEFKDMLYQLGMLAP
jgi:hypothetical protein